MKRVRKKQLHTICFPLALLVLSLFLISGCAQMKSAPTAQISQPAKADAGYKFICGCGPKCDCKTMADKPGNCVCGTKMIYKKILKEDADNYYFCACGEECQCDTLNPKNSNQCKCGKELMKFPKRGKYGCYCPPGCDCGTISQKPGKCVCGTEMKPI